MKEKEKIKNKLVFMRTSNSSFFILEDLFLYDIIILHTGNKSVLTFKVWFII